MKSILRKSKPPRGLLVAATLFVVAIFGVTFATRTQADTLRPVGNERLVTVHDQGEEKSFLTRADTIRTALESAKISIDANDLVEPSLDNQLVASNYEVNIYRARPVTIIDGATRVKVMSPYRTPKQIIENAGMQLRDEDETAMTVNADLVSDGSGVQLTIDRATEFSLKLYGKVITAYTQASTVEEMLKEKGITLAPQDTLAIAKDAPIVAGMKVEIWRNGKQTFTQEEEIKPSVRQIQDADQPVGYKKVQSAGKPGKKTVTYEIVMKNGKETSRKVIQTVVLEKAEERVEVVGAKVDGPEAIIAKIKAAAAAKGIDAQRVLLIAQCESHFNPMADAGEYKGIFQQAATYWSSRAAKYGFSGASYYDVDAQIGVSTSMMAEGGWSNWGCDPGPQ